MGFFDINYAALETQLLPVRWRKEVMKAWIKCLMLPVQYLYGLYMTKRADNLYTLAHNSQVCYLEAALNDLFDSSARRIHISDHVYYDPLYLFLDEELKPVPLDMDSEIGTGVIPNPDPVPLYTELETYTDLGLSFIINVPIAVTINTERLKALVNTYKLPGKKYSIHTF